MKMAAARTTKKRKRTVLSPTLPQLPKDIFVDILSRLPVKSLCRFRCVSKNVRALISNSRFIKLHFNRSKSVASNNETSQKLILNTVNKQLYSNNIQEGDALKRLDFQVPDALIVGTCNGLVCLLDHYRRTFFIFNPSTRQYNELPYSNLNLHGGNLFVGFGYDAINDDYKVIIGCSYCHHQSETKVFSTRTRTWRKLKDHVSSAIWRDSIFLNHCLHWKAEVPRNKSGRGLEYSIVSFDASYEKFNIVPLPDEVEPYSFNLEVLRGCLCMGITTNNSEFILWMMKDYGVKESWKRLTVIDYRRGYDLWYVKPICCAENGQILVLLTEACRKYLAMYNLENNSFIRINSNLQSRKNIILNKKIYQVGMYVDSLNSPYGQCDQGQEEAMPICLA